jgi:hypothetical protein
VTPGNRNERFRGADELGRIITTMVDDLKSRRRKPLFPDLAELVFRD